MERLATAHHSLLWVAEHLLFEVHRKHGFSDYDTTRSFRELRKCGCRGEAPFHDIRNLSLELLDGYSVVAATTTRKGLKFFAKRISRSSDRSCFDFVTSHVW